VLSGTQRVFAGGRRAASFARGPRAVGAAAAHRVTSHELLFTVVSAGSQGLAALFDRRGARVERRAMRAEEVGMRVRHLFGALTASALAVTALAGLAAPASAATGTATITAGSLAFVSTPPDVSFAATLAGQDQTVTAAQAIDVGDATGSGAGWNITATSTAFTTGGATPKTLSSSATTVNAGPTDVCDPGSTCTVATNAITYPYVLPAGTSAPPATKLFNAAANTGMGNQTVTPTWRLAVPANTSPGTYTSTWTISLVSGP
jgi:hypothetical protein